MSIIKTYHNFTINGEKVDRCPSRYGDIVGFICVIVVMLSFVIGFVLAAANSEGVYITYSGIITVIACAITLVYDRDRGCGIKITLYEPTAGNITTDYYPFTGNSDVDAKNITELVTLNENYAISIYNTQEKARQLEREKTAACCNQYKEVMKKVNQ